MKRLTIIGLVLLLSCQSGFAQQSSPQGDPDRLFYTASEQFQQGEFSGCFRSVETWLEETPSTKHLEEASFMLAASAWELNRKETSLLLIRFIADYPASPFVDKAYYYLGCSALDAGVYTDAHAYFKRCPETALTAKELPAYQFKNAFVSLQVGDTLTALSLFKSLSTGENRYAASAGFFLAYIDYARGNTTPALNAFANYEHNDQFSNVLTCFLIQLNYAEGRYAKAIVEANDYLAITTDPAQRTEMIRILAAASFDVKEYDQSRQAYIEYLKGNPTINRTDLYRMGVLNFMNGEYDRAISRFSGITGNKDKLGQSAFFHLGLCYLKKGSNEQARMCFEQASLTGFDAATKEKALYNHAVLCYETNYSAFNEQVNAFERFLNEFPTSDLKENVYKYLAEALLSSKDYKNSMAVLERVSNPDNTLLKTKARLFFLLGTDAFRTKEYDYALKSFNQSIDLAEKLRIPSTETYYWRGETYFQQQQYQLAFQDFSRFTSQPEAKTMTCWKPGVYSLGYACFELKRYTEALKWFNLFAAMANAQQDQRITDVYNRIGDCYFVSRQFDKAGDSYKKADKATNTGSDYAVYQDAITRGLQKNNTSKLSLLTTFKKRFPSSEFMDDVLFETGKTQALLNENKQAVNAYTELMTAYPNSPLSRKAGIQIALLYYNDKAIEEAISAYKVVIERYSGSQEAQVALSDLKQIYVNNNAVSDFIDYTANLQNPVKMDTDEKDSLSYKAAENQLMEGAQEKAMQAFNAYITAFPTGHYLTESHYNLAKLLLINNQIDDAIPHLTYVTTQAGNPFQTECLKILADINRTKGAYDQALQLYQQLAELTSDINGKIDAQTGMLHCYINLKQDQAVISTVGTLLSEPLKDERLAKEFLYDRAKAYLNLSNKDQALPDLKVLATEVQTAYGAESKYLLAQLYADQHKLKEAEATINQFMQDGTPHSYWLAKSFILLSDIFYQRADYVQARQYLLSLKENYNADDDIAGLIRERLSKIEQKTNQ